MRYHSHHHHHGHRFERIALVALIFLLLTLIGLVIWGSIAVTAADGNGKGLDVITAPCTPLPPHTTLPCSAANALQLLFCDLASNNTQIGNIYLCIGNSWTFYGALNVQGNGTAGSPGIGVYATQCAGGPPPTTTIGPSYVCDANFNLNMILCNLQSLDGNAGFVYECLCAPTCSWTEVGDLNGVITLYRQQSYNYPIPNVHNVWATICPLPLLKVGQYFCSVEGQVRTALTTQSCPLFYGVSSVDASNVWIANSNRILNVPPVVTGGPLEMSIITTAYVEVTTAPETVYVTAGIGSGTTGCGLWAPGIGIPITITCIKFD